MGGGTAILKKQVKKTISQNHGGLRIKSYPDMIGPSVAQLNPDQFICGNDFLSSYGLLRRADYRPMLSPVQEIQKME